ncbi:hypothetical protein A4D02_10515 [Niastella koreensis]|uniref:Uncharacterized protein n=2 Tax=Niastella koreensis TaxID=354356 RepID=G8TR67_NIAKG|nr:hypothetical protein [Niastella koreensis]AEV98981.1 hypothetical protein Niako_2641 [Niastella koreensis GR20-10]OQP43902.1 hypothetical protein A4D02_10515 [Niastella koreensis]
MAKLEGNIQITGSLDNLSFYKMRGSDKIIVRRKGGPSAEQVRKAPNFENTRRNNGEFGGRAAATALIKQVLNPLRFLADYNITGPLNALLKPIQHMDTDNDWGQRSIIISKNARLLQGFSLNRRYQLDTILRTPVLYSLKQQQVVIDIPELLPGLNFITPGNYSWYKFIATAGIIPDVYYRDDNWGYQPKGDFNYQPSVDHSAWFPTNAHAGATTLTIDGLPEVKPEDHSILIAIGIAFGTMQGTEIQPVKYVGAGKVIGME